MPRKPQGDMDNLTIPKGDIAAPADTAPAPSAGSKAYAHTLSLRLTSDQYRRLRRYTVGQEESTGHRITHQSIIEAALAEWLDRNGG